jgi:phosphoglycerate kinase
MSWKTLDDLDLKGKRVLMRVDFNVPLDSDGQVGDDTRIRGALPSIRHILEQGGTPVLMTHLGRPKGTPDPAYSVAPAAERLSVLLDAPVVLAPATVGADVEAVLDATGPGEVVMLENTRFNAGETDNDPEFSAQLARLGDVYVNDAFGAAHRAHASTEGVARLLDERAAGFLMDRELATLKRITDSPEKPFVAIVGGAKVSDKIGVIRALLGTADALLIGGAMAYTFLKAQGTETGTSLVEDDRLDLARELLDEAGERLHLPVDHVCAGEFKADAPATVVKGAIPAGRMGLDIGPATREAYEEIIVNARTVVWNGPMGVFEMEPFAAGTRAIANALAKATENGAFTVVGGGDSVAAITEAGLDDAVSHVSTGGGAMLELLEGQTLPGVAVLDQ